MSRKNKNGDMLFETRECTLVSCWCSGFSGSVQPMRSLSSNRYRGQRCTIDNIQSRSLSFPHRGSDSCLARKWANVGLYDGCEGDKIFVRDVIVVLNDVMKGV
jgi:hypothetical protein